MRKTLVLIVLLICRNSIADIATPFSYGPTLPASCAEPALFLLTSATSGQRWYACESGVFVKQGDSAVILTRTGTTLYPTTAGDTFGNNSSGSTWSINNLGEAVFTGGVTTGTATDPAVGGAIGLDNADMICWRNSEDTADVCIAVDASEILQMTGGTIDAADLSGTVPDASINGAVEADEVVGTETDEALCSWEGTSSLIQCDLVPGIGVATALAVDANSVGAFPTIIAQGSVALDTDAIASTACDTSDTGLSATGVAATDVIQWTPNADISTVTGYAPATTGGLIIYVYPGTNTVSFKVCNPTSASITPGAAVTVNWRVIR